MAADLIVPPATLSRWGMPNKQHHSQLSDRTTMAAWMDVMDGGRECRVSTFF